MGVFCSFIGKRKQELWLPEGKGKGTRRNLKKKEKKTHKKKE